MQEFVNDLDAPGYCQYRQCLGNHLVFWNFYINLKPLGETQQLSIACVCKYLWMTWMPLGTADTGSALVMLIFWNFPINLKPLGDTKQLSIACVCKNLWMTWMPLGIVGTGSALVVCLFWKFFINPKPLGEIQHLNIACVCKKLWMTWMPLGTPGIGNALVMFKKNKFISILSHFGRPSSWVQLVFARICQWLVFPWVLPVLAVPW
jgi:hypothetical protein